MTPEVPEPKFLARGPWEDAAVTFSWSDEKFQPDAEVTAKADAAVAALKARNSPSHDGIATRLARHSVDDKGNIHFELQAARWALRLVPGEAARSMTGLCVVRDHDGRWLAGRRAAWVATWAGRWTLGAGGAVDPGESPMHTLRRELEEEWGVEPASLQGEALLLLPGDVVMFVGIANLAPGAQIVMDHEHDEHEWWPAAISEWPQHAEPALRALAYLVSDQ